MRDSMAMLDVLNAREFVPRDDGVAFDLSFGSRYEDRLVRVIMDETDILILLMTGNEAEISRVTLRHVPLEVFEMNLNVVTRAARSDRSVWGA